MKLNLKNIKTKTLLIYPPNPLKKEYLAKMPRNTTISNFPVFPLGLAILSGYLKKLGYKSIKIINLGDFDITGAQKYNLDIFSPPKSIIQKTISDKKLIDNFDKKLTNEFKKTLIKFKPNIIGFSILYSNQFYYALKIAEIIKSYDKKIFVVLGGPYISLYAENIANLKEPEDYLPKLIDGYIFDCGENPLAELIVKIDRKKPLDKIPNSYFLDANKKFKKNRRVLNPNPKYLVMPDFGEIEKETMPLRLSTGCYWGKCSFCTHCKIHTYCAAEIDQIIRTIKELIRKHNSNKFLICDDSIHPLLLKKLSEKIIKEKLSISWKLLFLNLDSCFLKDKKIVKLMKRAGCLAVMHFGMESATPRILKLMKKQHNRISALKILRLFKKEGIEAGIGVMLGFPTETKKEAKMTLAFLKKYSDLYYTATIKKFSLSQKSDIYNNLNKYHITKKIAGSMDRPIYSPRKGMTTRELEVFFNNYLAKELNKFPGRRLINLDKFRTKYLVKI